MKVFLFKNHEKSQSFEPDAFVRIKIGDIWKDIGTAKKYISAAGTFYYEMELEGIVTVDKPVDNLGTKCV